MKLSNFERLRILEVRATTSSSGRQTPWDQVAAETGHSKSTVLDVNEWFKKLAWKDVERLPRDVQKLREDYVERLEQEIIEKKEPVSEYVGLVGPVPDVLTSYPNPIGRMPSYVHITESTLGTEGQVFVGPVSQESIHLRAATGCSGVVATAKIECGGTPTPVKYATIEYRDGSIIYRDETGEREMSPWNNSVS